MTPSLPDAPASERVALTSVGIDVGSATLQVVFSRVQLERRGAQLSSAFQVTSREILWSSEISFTPYEDTGLIDAAAVSRFVDQSFAASGLTPGDIDTGAVLVTGAAAEKENAENIIEALAADAGKFVCAAAGPTLEGRLAALGSGAMDLASRPALNVDIGGATTKIALIGENDVDHVHALHVGGRLIAWDDAGTVTRLEPAGRALAESAGLRLSVGSEIRPREASAIADIGAAAIMDALVGGDARDAGLPHTLDITSRLPFHEARTLVFSGGVGRLIAEGNDSAFGDLGRPLAKALQAQLGESEWTVAPCRETIRATVVGAGQSTFQLSGSTIWISHMTVLPLRNMPVSSPPADQGELRPADVERAVTEALEPNARTPGPVALSLRLSTPLSPGDIGEFAAGILAALSSAHAMSDPVVIAIDKDMARLLGSRISEAHPDFQLVVIDQVVTKGCSFLDVGAVHPESGAVPVVAKTLVF